MFVIHGVWKLTAERACVRVEARDEDQALAFARSRGIIPFEVYDTPSAEAPADETAENPRP